MSWRARPLVAGIVAVASTAVVLTGCSLSNSSTARSTPTPASDQPYPTPSPTETPTPTPSADVTASPTPTPTGTPTPTPSPSPSPEPTTAAHAVYAYLDSVARTGDGYAVSYRTATRCVAVKAPTCKPKPDDVFADGSWLAKPAKKATRSPLAPKATGSVKVKGKTVELSIAALTPLPAPGGLVVDLRSTPMAVKVTADTGVTRIAQLQ
jgi:hypothetical protein